MSLFGHRLVTFESLYKKRKSVFLVSFESTYLFSHFGSVAGRVFHKIRAKEWPQEVLRVGREA